MTCLTPRTCWKTPWTPQKQPPASTAVCSGPAVFGLSTAGGAIVTGASAPYRGDRQRSAEIAPSTTSDVHTDQLDLTTDIRTPRRKLRSAMSETGPESV